MTKYSLVASRESSRVKNHLCNLSHIFLSLNEVLLFESVIILDGENSYELCSPETTKVV